MGFGSMGGILVVSFLFCLALRCCSGMHYQASRAAGKDQRRGGIERINGGNRRFGEGDCVLPFMGDAKKD